MTAPHADGEDLARLAMQDAVSADVAAHVAACAECSKDLSLLKSLLEAEGPDGSDGGGTEPFPHETTEVTDAWADANDSGTTADSATAEPPPSDQSTPAATTTAGRRANSTALVVALVLFVGAVLLALFALR